MAKCYDDYSRDELIKLLHKQDEELAIKKYGLTWDSEKEPEKVVLDCENNFPILENVPEKEIKTDDSDFNILIEGDNYHALTVLNYTHKEKINVIYIDPPYNTGNKDFKYNDYYVDKENSYRHSKWLNFMEKRLNLAKNLLTENGVIFISIDDNEQANLKLLCDKIFEEKNFICTFIRKTKSMTGDDGNGLNIQFEYLIAYGKNKSLIKFKGLEKDFTNYSNPDNDVNGDWCSGDPSAKSGGTSTYFAIENPYTGQVDYPPKGRYWAFSKASMEEYVKSGRIVFKKEKRKNQRGFIFKRYKNQLVSKENAVGTLNFIDNIYMNQVATKETNEIIPNNKFNYPKPLFFIKDLMKSITNNESIILDFMAGTGTTGHAILSLNNEDNMKRKFILCTNNENNICSDVCYPRISKIINGYKKNGNGEFINGVGGNLKYFKTDLMPVEKIHKVNDKQRQELTQRAGQMIAIKENTFNQIELNEWFQVFENNSKSHQTAIYFREDLSHFDELIGLLKDTKTTLYIFSYGRIDKKLFNYLNENISIEDIPEPIIDIYKEINLTLKDK